MKVIAACIPVLTLLLAIASSAAAWQVNITNKTSASRGFKVQGQHLFVIEDDCQVEVAKGETKACVLPGAICPAAIDRTITCLGGQYTSKIGFLNPTCCWNINVEATDGSSWAFPKFTIK